MDGAGPAPPGTLDSGVFATDRLFLFLTTHGWRTTLLVQEVFATNWIAPTGPMVTRFEDDLAALTRF